MAHENPEIRPTKSVVIRALRDMLRPIIHGTVILELFAGTGRVGRALLDEGADRVIGVDHRGPLEPLPESYEWIRRDVEDVVREGPGEPIDIVFMDPPYQSRYPGDLLAELDGVPWLRDEGIVIIETARAVELPDHTDGDEPLYLMRKRHYGGSRLWVYQAGRDKPGYKE